ELAFGRSATPIGWTLVMMKIHDQVIKVEAAVAEEESSPVLLGLNVLEILNIQIDWKNRMYGFHPHWPKRKFSWGVHFMNVLRSSVSREGTGVNGMGKTLAPVPEVLASRAGPGPVQSTSEEFDPVEAPIDQINEEPELIHIAHAQSGDLDNPFQKVV